MSMPVVMHHESDPNLQIITYAMLDNQSNACFVSESIIKKNYHVGQKCDTQSTCKGSGD